MNLYEIGQIGPEVLRQLRGHICNLEPADWSEQTWRQDHPQSAHKDSEFVLYHGPAMLRERPTAALVFNELGSVWQRSHPGIELACEAVQAAACGLLLGRVMLVRLKPGGVITPHVDEGSYAAYYDRFHVPLNRCPMASLRFGEHQPVGEGWAAAETYSDLNPGAIYWFGRRTLHSGYNRGATPRYHLIVDVRL